jgi:DNA-binding PadR family transcriptional regulator
MSNSLPPVTHLQILVLEAVNEDEQIGRDLRDRLASHGVRNSAPAFYQMMARLEEGGLVEGWYEQKLVDGQNVKERRYRITRRGRHALAETRHFYLSRAFMTGAAKKPSHA